MNLSVWEVFDFLGNPSVGGTLHCLCILGYVFKSFYSDEDEDEDESDEEEEDSDQSEEESDSEVEEVYVKKGKKGKKAPPPKKSKKVIKKPKKPSHPPVGEMFVTAIKRLRDNPRKGSSIAAIKGKFLSSKFYTF